MHRRLDDRVQHKAESGDREQRADEVGPLCCRFLESATSASANANPAAAIGTLIRNTDPHAKWGSSNPATIGPSAIPAPLVAAQNPIARWRSCRSLKVLVMIASVEGMIKAAPTPMLARAAISIATEPERPPTSSTPPDRVKSRGAQDDVERGAGGRIPVPDRLHILSQGREHR